MKESTCTFPLPQTQRNRVTQKSMSVHYGEWLNTMQWDNFCTFTTRYSLSLKSARNSMGRLSNFIVSEYGFKTKIFWTAEPFDTKYGYHLHALIKIEGKTTPLFEYLIITLNFVKGTKFPV